MKLELPKPDDQNSKEGVIHAHIHTCFGGDSIYGLLFSDSTDHHNILSIFIPKIL